MNNLQGEVVGVEEVDEVMRTRMFELMRQSYENVSPLTFSRDLAEKDQVLLLRDDTETIQGFTTISYLTIPVHGSTVRGIFSGDTVIAHAYRGQMELQRVWLRHAVRKSDDEGGLFWFLTSKGYKTYRMLPSFFHQFYPAHNVPTPSYEQAIMHAFGEYKYKGAYDPEAGVIHYSRTRDAVRKGVADISSEHREDPHINFFVQVNPTYVDGDDLVCLTKISRNNLKEVTISFIS